jgi:hypothetical protein
LQSKLRKIVSGGQTGADRAALDFAIENGIEIGGFVPLGRLAEDGQISTRYPNLIETLSADPRERTMLNIRHSDATLIVSHGDLSGGTKLTERLAGEYEKPVLHIDLLQRRSSDAVSITRKWLAAADCRILNIAGPRLSEDAAIYDDTRTFLSHLFA